MHQNVLAGRPQANAELAVKDVKSDENGEVRTGRRAFVETIAATKQGSGAFPVKQIHDEFILSDGHLGQVEYVWQGAQVGEYAGRAPDGKVIRMRGMLFFEFDAQGLVEKVVSVFDERVVMEQLESNATYYLYP